jgi:hypothetical protein
MGILPKCPSKYTSVMNFLWEIAQTNLLLPTEDLARTEVLKGGSLKGNERLELWTKTVTIYHECLREQSICNIPQQTYEQLMQFEKEEKAARDKIKMDFGVKQSSFHLSNWWKKPETRIDEWVTEYLEKNAIRLNLCAERRNWPHPQAFESIWRFHAYKMARIYLNVRENRRIQGSDLFDAHHYVAASYTNIMVCNDGDLRDTFEIIPKKSFILETFEEFLCNRLDIDKS